MMDRIFLTGANGFAGHYIAAALANAGYEVHGLVKSALPAPSKNIIKAYEADLNDTDTLKKIIGDIRPRKIIHLAAIAFVAHGNAKEIYEVNLLGTRSLLESLTFHNIDYDSVMLMSSANVYGNALGGQIDENTPPSPKNDYALSKLAMEYLGNIYSTLPFIIVRPFNYTGVGQSTDFLVPKIVNHARRKIHSLQLGNIDVARDFSDVRFVANACLRLLENTASIGETINICSGQAYGLTDIVKQVESLSGHQFQLKTDALLKRSNEVCELWGDPTKLHSLIGETRVIPLSETLRWMLDSPSSGLA